MIDFRIIGIDVIPKTKTVIITTTLNVDKRSVNDETVQVLRSDLTSVPCTYKVEQDKIYVELLEYPKYNSPYSVKICDLVDIIGNKLVQGARKKIVFKSNIHSTVKILNPIDFESIDELQIIIEEILRNETDKPIGEYRIDISTDQAFYYIERSFLSSKTSFTIDGLLPNQYFLRARCENETDNGNYSDVITFVIKESNDNLDDNQNNDNESDFPIIEEDIHILQYPSSGINTDTILIEFDTPIDPKSLSDISIIRRDV